MVSSSTRAIYFPKRTHAILWMDEIHFVPHILKKVPPLKKDQEREEQVRTPRQKRFSKPFSRFSGSEKLLNPSPPLDGQVAIFSVTVAGFGGKVHGQKAIATGDPGRLLAAPHSKHEQNQT